MSVLDPQEFAHRFTRKNLLIGATLSKRRAHWRARILHQPSGAAVVLDCSFRMLKAASRQSIATTAEKHSGEINSNSNGSMHNETFGY